MNHRPSIPQPGTILHCWLLVGAALAFAALGCGAESFDAGSFKVDQGGTNASDAAPALSQFADDALDTVTDTASTGGTSGGSGPDAAFDLAAFDLAGTGGTAQIPTGSGGAAGTGGGNDTGDANATGGAAGTDGATGGTGGTGNLSLGLVGYWKLDEGTGSAIADSSGQRTTGTLTGSPSWASPASSAPTSFSNASALVLNGSSQSARLSRSTTLEPASFTVALWARRTPGAPQSVFAKIFEKQYTTASPYDSIALNINHAGDPSVVTLDLSLNISGTPTAANISSATGAMPDGAWTHIVGIYQPAGSAPQERLYINGVLKASSTRTDPVVYDRTTAGDFYLGQNGRGLQFFAGSIDDVRIYNRALTDDEIHSLYAGTP